MRFLKAKKKHYLVVREVLLKSLTFAAVGYLLAYFIKMALSRSKLLRLCLLVKIVASTAEHFVRPAFLSCSQKRVNPRELVFMLKERLNLQKERWL